MSRSATWVFTINNYKEGDLERLTHLDASKYTCIFGEEVGEQGTPHLQGFLRCEKRLMRSNVEKVLGGHAWLDVTHDEEAAIGYCLKEGRIKGNVPMNEKMGAVCKMCYEVCKRLGMSKYIYQSVYWTWVNEHEDMSEEELKVAVGYNAWLEGIKWWEK